MNIATKPAHSSLAQRIAKVRNCILVEAATSIFATDKDLFESLCQIYEHQSVATHCLPDDTHESLPHWISSISNLTQEATRPVSLVSILSRSASLWQQSSVFLVTNRTDFSWDDGDGFSDWSDYG